MKRAIPHKKTGPQEPQQQPPLCRQPQRSQPMDPLLAILSAQEGRFRGLPDYHTAHTEIRRGAKHSCWMWYIWPSYTKVRQHRMPAMLLPNVATHVEYLKDELLGSRVLEMTELANFWLLQRRVNPHSLFGFSVDSDKFHETCTAFSIASMWLGDEESAQVFAASLPFVFGGWNEAVVKAILEEATEMEEQQAQMKHTKQKHYHYELSLREATERVRAMLPPPPRGNHTKRGNHHHRKRNNDESSPVSSSPKPPPGSDKKDTREKVQMKSDTESSPTAGGKQEIGREQQSDADGHQTTTNERQLTHNTESAPSSAAVSD